MGVLTNDQLTYIKDYINLELVKRSFPAAIGDVKECEPTWKHPYLTFESEPFQTVPAIFKSIQIVQFSTNVIKDERTNNRGDIVTTKSVYADVSVAYEMFNGGRNCSTLFSISMTFSDDRSQPFEYSVM